MPPKATQSSSQQGGPKQTSLLGFFSKPASTSTGGNNRSRPPATPASGTARTSHSTTKAKAAASTSKEAAEKRRQAIQAATQSSPTANIKTLAASDARENGRFVAREDNAIDNGGSKMHRAESDASVNGAMQLKPQDKVDSDVFLGSSPLSAVDVLDDDVEQPVVESDPHFEAGKEKVNGEAQENSKSGDEATVDVEMTNGEESVGATIDAREADEDEDDHPVRSSARNSKRKITYIETDDEDSDDSKESRKATSAATGSAKNGRASLSGRKKAKVEDDDDFEFDDAGLADEDLDVMMNDFESSPEKSVADLPDSDDEVTFATKRSKAKSASVSRAKASVPQRPPAKPLGGGNASGSGRMQSGSGAGGFMTQAERSKIDAKEKKAAEQDCFDFLLDLKDKEGHRPDHPEYDARTVHIPSKAWNTFTPFERQFWEIKQNHFDTVLFFQKGKFYELYEKDAEIGHNEFDLKLTDRVKMKMVGVPEQSFDYWCAKFLAAGYKVGKVEQAETAIGMEMRTKAAAGKTKNKADSIVRRELAAVLTNGTVVDEAFLSGDEACHCIAIKEAQTEGNNSSYGICILDAATGRFELTAFEDDVCRTKLETLFRQLRPRELVFSKGNLGVVTSRLLRNILPMNANWVSLKPGSEFYDEAKTRSELAAFFGNVNNDEDDAEMAGNDPTKLGIPEAISNMLDKSLAIEALGGMMFYLRSLNMANDLLSQRSFNVYDPIRRGENLVLDGQTLSHLEVLVNNEGGEEGTLLQLLQRCATPFGKRLFRIWLTAPLQKIDAINARQDAVADLIADLTFSERFHRMAKDTPDLERLISRIHAGRCKQSDFLKVLNAFQKVNKGFSQLSEMAQSFSSTSVSSLLRGAPDMTSNLAHIQGMFEIVDGDILPTPGASEECDEASAAVEQAEGELEDVLEEYKTLLKCADLTYWHSAQGAKDIYVIQAPVKVKVPANWTKTGGTKAHNKYVTGKTQPLIRQVQEARETRKIAFQGFFSQLLQEFDNDREVWLKAVRIFAELDCLLSLAKASADLDEPRCRPVLVESEEAFIDFKDLRHPALCLRSDFISNDVQLGNQVPRQTLLTGPNTAGKSTLCRMTSVAVIMAQLGALLPASQATIAPIDKIQTRMGAYDNMFSNSSTFKVELDECAKILRDGGPKSLVILDELGRGTSTYDGMAIAEAVLHHLSTVTLPLGFFATHYGALTDDFKYHPNVRCMHMQTQVDDIKREVICLYKLIEGRAESSYGTHVAHLAGVPDPVVARAEQVSSEFFADFKQKMILRRKSNLPVLAQADFHRLIQAARKPREQLGSSFLQQLQLIRRAIDRYES